MDSGTALALEFVRNLGKAIRTLRAYSAEHRQFQGALAEAYRTLQRLLEKNPSVVLGTREGALILQSRPVHDAGPAAQGFCEMLSDRNIATFTVERGATPAEFGHLVKILSMNPEDLLEANVIRQEHLRPLQHIRINELKFVAVREGTPEGEVLGAGTAAGGLPEFLKVILAGAGGAAGGGPGEGGTISLQSLGSALKPLMGSAGQDEAVQMTARHFDQIVEQCLGNVPALRFLEEYLKGVAALPETARRAILQTTGVGERAGEPEAMIGRLPLAMRGRIVAEDLRRGTTEPERLRQVFRRLATSPGEFVQLLETVSRLVAESASSPEEAERKAADLDNLLPLSGERRIRRPSVLLILRDLDFLDSCEQALEEAGFAVAACRYPDPDLAEILRSGVLDALVIDIGPYRRDQLTFLGEIRKVSDRVPLVLIEDVLAVRDPSEVELCSQGSVLYKPLEPQKLVQTLQEMISVSPGSLPPPPNPEEVDSARQIQRELVPRELPGIPGFTLAARAEPGRGWQAGYHDVLALPDRRYGLFLMDVVGGPAASLMALLAARSNLQRLFLQAGHPAVLLAGLNDLLADAVPRGSFVRATGAVLEADTGRMVVAGGGHPRPWRWHPGNPGIRVLQTGGPPLGLRRGPDFEKSLRAVTVTLAPGDHVFFHTPGVLHVSSPKGEELGERGIARALLAAPGGRAGLALVEVLEAVFRHRSDGVPEEGFTLLELHREEVPEGESGS